MQQWQICLKALGERRQAALKQMRKLLPLVSLLNRFLLLFRKFEEIIGRY
jgi:hypothetical protein